MDARQALPVVVRNVIDRYRSNITAAASLLASDDSNGPPDFTAPFLLPPPSSEWFKFFEPAAIALQELDTYLGHRIILLDLMRNPRTRTTKTFASLTMVARAIAHSARSGERVAFLTPSSGNKAMALRDAVLRAYELGLASPASLRVFSVVPPASTGKLRDSALSDSNFLRRANPVVVHRTSRPDGVRDSVRELAAELSELALRRHGWRLWNSSHLDNYRFADCVRAFVEAECLPAPDPDVLRWHVHAVSSGYGPLGYSLGHRCLRQGAGYVPGCSRAPSHPAFLLVQQLATPGLVLSVLGERGEQKPDYTRDESREFYVQHESAHFPSVTDSPVEMLDPTFYATRPSTAPAVRDMLARHGGDGIVVSRKECLELYETTSRYLTAAGHLVPGNPREVREWSSIMALTGALLAVDRGLLPDSCEVVVHGTGLYCDASLPPMPARKQATSGDLHELKHHFVDAMRIS